MTIANFIYGLLVITAGVLMVKYNYRLTNLFGRNNFFERRLGSGSTYLVMQILAILTIIFGTLWAVSMHDNVVRWLVSPITNLLNP